MANNFYKSIDEAFDRFEVGNKGMVYENVANSVWIPVHVTKVLFKYNIIIYYNLLICFSQIYVKKNILKIPPHVLLPEDKVKKWLFPIRLITIWRPNVILSLILSLNFIWRDLLLRRLQVCAWNPMVLPLEWNLDLVVFSHGTILVCSKCRVWR